MRRLSNTPLAFPDFKGVTRLLILVNLASFFILLVIRTLSGPLSQEIASSWPSAPGS